MARRRGRHSFKIPVISTAILASQVFLAHELGGSPMGQLDFFQSLYTGISITGGPQPARLLIGYGPWLVKRFVGAVARPRVPFKGLPISLS